MKCTKSSKLQKESEGEDYEEEEVEDSDDEDLDETIGKLFSFLIMCPSWKLRFKIIL